MVVEGALQELQGCRVVGFCVISNGITEMRVSAYRLLSIRETLQPRVHEVNSTSRIELRIHRDFPETRKGWLTGAQAFDIETIVGKTVVESVRPD